MSVVRSLPKGVEQGKTKNYLIDPLELLFADGGFDPESDTLEYHNIRHALSDRKLVGAGLERPKMLELIERIRTEGLLQSPICRWYKDGVQVVDGERRTRAIHKLKADNAECWDKDSKQFVPAKELYSKIEVSIRDMTDEEALKINFSASESGEKFGEGAIVAYCKILRQWGKSDKEIIDLTGYSIEWLRQTDKLMGLDEKSFLALSNNKITRELAGDLLEIEDMDVRLAELDRRIEAAEKRHAKTTDVLHSKVETAIKKVEAADEATTLLKVGLEPDTGKPDPDAKDPAKMAEKIEEVKQKKSKAEKIVKAAKEKLAKHQETGAKAGSKTATEPKPLNYHKVEKHWLEVAIAAIKSDCKDEEDQDMDVDLEDVYLTKFLCEQMRKGQTDIIRILKAHKKHKMERAAKIEE